MNGAESLIRSLVDAGVNICFANPGTSEMHLVQAIDAVPEMRAVLCLFEGVCTGAADGYGRMQGVPATTLLHLGPGLGNGIANLHNARRAATPIINLIGNHALYHVKYDAPLTSDIDTLAKNVSSWIKSDSTARSLAADGMAALQAANTLKPGSLGQISTLIVPADACWGEAEGPVGTLDVPAIVEVDDKVIADVAGKIDSNSMILLNNDGLSLPARIAASRIQAETGCRIALTTFPRRVDGGPGTPVFERLPYFPEHVMATLKNINTLVLAGSDAPVSFFAYPDYPSELVPDSCEAVVLADGNENVTLALQSVADSINAPESGYPVFDKRIRQVPAGKLSVATAATLLAGLLPENSIVCGDSGGGGAFFVPAQETTPHTWLNLTGGSIGQGGPVSVGAAIARPESRVLALLGDGAAMYTNQAFWTQAREGLDVTTVIYSNHRYGILETEYLRLGVNEIGDRAGDLFDLSRPFIDFVSLAGSMGVPGRVAKSCEEFSAALELSFSQPGPFVIEARV